MPSSNWESLVVKRSISKLSSTISSRKCSSSSESSQLSNRSIKSAQSNAKRASESVSHSRLSKAVSSSSSSSQSQYNPPDVMRSQSSLLAQKCLPQDSTQGGSERKTLVPIAPFLSGHAHSFSSFETNRLEHKFQKRTVLAHHNTVSNPVPQSNIKERRLTALPRKNTKLEAHPGLIVSRKRRPCSLDSDSVSSGSSSLESPPMTPGSEKIRTGPGSAAGKKVRCLVVPPETLSDILKGSLKVEIRKSSKNGSAVVFRSVKKSSVANSFSENPALNCMKADGPSSVHSLRSTNSSSNNVIMQDHTYGNNLEITPVGPLHEIIGSQDLGPGPAAFSSQPLPISSDSTRSHIEAINMQLQAESIKSHISAINSHMQAINESVGCGNLCVPLDFAELCMRFASKPPSGSSSDVISNFGSSDENSSTSSEPSFIPVGYLEKQDSSSTEMHSENSRSFSHLDSQGYNEPFD